MNILIIGPGTDEKRFGRSFVNLANKDSHNIYEFSFRLEKETPEEITTRFENLVASIDKIDVMLYNVMAGHYPGTISSFTSNHTVNFEGWNETVLCNVGMPHMFSIKSLSKMDNSSSIVFMTSAGSYMPPTDSSIAMYSGYFGSKAAQNHLMWALSDFNDKKTKVFSIAPHFPYEDQEMTDKIILEIYKKITNISNNDNGKILSCFPPECILKDEDIR